jgi:hypothetical protein
MPKEELISRRLLVPLGMAAAAAAEGAAAPRIPLSKPKLSQTQNY